MTSNQKVLLANTSDEHHVNESTKLRLRVYEHLKGRGQIAFCSLEIYFRFTVVLDFDFLR